MNIRRLPAVAAVVLVAIIAAPARAQVAPPPARAQVDAVVRLKRQQPQPQQQPSDDDDDGEAEVVAPVEQVFFVDDANFDQWIFGGDRNPGQGRSKLEAMLKAQIQMVDRDYGLTEAQKKKLELAGHGDAKRFFDRVRITRTAFDAVRSDRQKFSDFHRKEVQPLQQAYQSGIFGDGSFFAKSLTKTLDASQAAHYQSAARERTNYRLKAKLRLALASIDGNVGLTADQRKRLWKLIEEEVRLPKRFGDLGELDYSIVTIQLARLPESKLRPIFSTGQWRLLSSQFDMARRMEPVLIGSGVMPDELAKDSKKAP